MPKPATRERRIAKRASMSLAVIVLLASTYVSSFLGVCWLRHGYLGGEFRWSDRVHAPFYWYIDSALPGSLQFAGFTLWCESRFRASFDECLEIERRQAAHNKAHHVPPRDWSPFQERFDDRHVARNRG